MNVLISSIFQLVTLLSLAGVSLALTVDIFPNSILQPSKTEVMLNCLTNPKDGAILIWQKDGNDISLYPPSGADAGTAYTLANNSLYIKSLKRRQTGTYVCVVIFGSERRIAKVIVEIAYLQKFAPMDSVQAYEGGATEFNCPRVLGKPHPTIAWKFNGQPITDNRFTRKDWRLQISSVKLSDAGNYTCIASNLAKIREVTATLQVIIPGVVEATPMTDEIKEMESSRFTCVSKANPPLPVSWLKVVENCDTVLGQRKCNTVTEAVGNGTTVSVDGGSLNFTKALYTDRGIYRCIARLGSLIDSAEVTLNIVELVKIDTSKQNNYQRKDRRRHSSARLTCHFRGDGPLIITWSRINSISPTLPPNMVPKNNTLNITDLSFKDAGQYQCKADGPFNTVSAVVNLVVYESSQFVLKPVNISAEIGRPVWVHCKGDGQPKPTVIYLKDERGAKELNESHFEVLPNGTLRIKKLKAGDEGPYLCWLTQLKSGSVFSRFYIKIKEPEIIGEKNSGSMGKTIAIAVGCAGVYILLVIGLMIYCRARRARLMKKGIITEVDENGDTKNPLLNGIPLNDIKSLERWQFPRDGLEEIETLGRGKMGRVFKANAHGITEGVKCSLVVVKEFVDRGEEYKSEFDLEVEMFAQLNHENVVRLLGVTTDESPYYIITQFSEEGDLKSYLQQDKDLTPAESLNICYGIACGMEYLISLRYIHRDLAARNCIVYPDKTIKVTFLSLCEDVYKEDYYLLNDIPVPIRWLSPEGILSESYSEKSDVWSYGVTMWEIFASGEQPYTEYDNVKVQNGVCKDLRLPQPPACPQPVYDVMQKCWIIDVSNRPSFTELTSLLADINLEGDA